MRVNQALKEVVPERETIALRNGRHREVLLDALDRKAGVVYFVVEESARQGIIP